MSFGFLTAEHKGEVGTNNQFATGESEGAKPPQRRRHGKVTKGVALRHRSRDERAQHRRNPKTCILTILHLSKDHLQTRATLKNRIPISPAASDAEKPFRDSSKKALRLALRWLGAALDGATGLKPMPLASILEVEIPELHFAGRPPNENDENKVAAAGGRGAREGRTCFGPCLGSSGSGPFPGASTQHHMHGRQLGTRFKHNMRGVFPREPQAVAFQDRAVHVSIFLSRPDALSTRRNVSNQSPHACRRALPAAEFKGYSCVGRACVSWLGPRVRRTQHLKAKVERWVRGSRWARPKTRGRRVHRTRFESRRRLVHS